MNSAKQRWPRKWHDAKTAQFLCRLLAHLILMLFAVWMYSLPWKTNDLQVIQSFLTVNVRNLTMFACIAATSFRCRILLLCRSLRLKHLDFKHSLHDAFFISRSDMQVVRFLLQELGVAKPSSGYTTVMVKSELVREWSGESKACHDEVFAYCSLHRSVYDNASKCSL